MPPFTAAELAYFRAEYARFQRVGAGVDPDQDALQHYPDRKNCRCHHCAGTPIRYTVPPPVYALQVWFGGGSRP